MLKSLATVAAVVLVAVGVTGCEYLGAADKFTRAAVKTACAQPELARATERAQLATWGLWTKCVPPDSAYDSYELVKRPAQAAQR